MIFEMPAKIVILYFIIAILFVVIIVVFFAVLMRRFYKDRHFKALDREREIFAPYVEALISSSSSVDLSLFNNKQNSIKWLAAEDLLLKSTDGADDTKIRRLLECFDELGITEVYLKDLKSDNKYRASLCAERLGRLKCARSVPGLIDSLKSDNTDLKNMAVNALGIIGDGSAISALMERFMEVIDEKEDISGRIIKNALISFGTDAIPHLMRELGNSLWRVRSRVLDVLCEIESPDLKEVFISALTDLEPDVRAKGAKGLGVIKEADGTLGPLTKLYDDEVWIVRYQCVRALGYIGDKSSIELFKRAIADSNWQVRSAAAQALGGYGVSAIKELTDVMLKSDDRFACEQVAEELQRSGLIFDIIENLRKPSGSELSEDMLFDIARNGVLSPLIDAMDDPDPEIRRNVAGLLGRIGNFRARDVLQRCAKNDNDNSVKLEASRALQTVPIEDPATA